ncbi:alpha/beta fold hydrolase [Nocardia sp. NPDC059091]|uniref:alpha/beta fold hydrolase n=1 Tax=unclassified Nocardia TaxID=2637762 RepID=UPI003692808A
MTSTALSYAAAPNRVVRADHAALQRVSAITHPVFIANGDSDPMILPHFSYLLAGMIPQARIKIYPDSAHGFLFQHAREFAADVGDFLGDIDGSAP